MFIGHKKLFKKYMFSLNLQLQLQEKYLFKIRIRQYLKILRYNFTKTFV